MSFLPTRFGACLLRGPGTDISTSLDTRACGFHRMPVQEPGKSPEILQSANPEALLHPQPQVLLQPAGLSEGQGDHCPGGADPKQTRGDQHQDAPLQG